MPYPEAIQQLIREFDKMPGVGSRTAERLAFYVLRAPPEDALNLALAIRDVRKNVRTCSACCNVAVSDPCPICADPGRDRESILVVEQANDLEAFEAAGYRGLYHVLGGALNPVEGVDAEHLTVDRLKRRVEAAPAAGARPVREVILGMDPDFEGEGTALLVAATLKKSGVKVTRLARGLPSGSAIEYSNAAVLADAIEGRRALPEAGAGG